MPQAIAGGGKGRSFRKVVSEEAAFDEVIGDAARADGRCGTAMTGKRRDRAHLSDEHEQLGDGDAANDPEMALGQVDSARLRVFRRKAMVEAALKSELGIPRPQPFECFTAPTRRTGVFLGGFVALVCSAAGLQYLACNSRAVRAMFRFPNLEAVEALFRGALLMNRGAISRDAESSSFPARVWFFVALRWGMGGDTSVALARRELGGTVTDTTVRRWIDKWLSVLRTHSQFTVSIPAAFQLFDRLLRADALAVGDGFLTDHSLLNIETPPEWLEDCWAFGYKNAKAVGFSAQVWCGTGYVCNVTDAVWGKIKEIVALEIGGVVYILKKDSTVGHDKGPWQLRVIARARLRTVSPTRNDEVHAVTGIKQITKEAAREQGAIAAWRANQEQAFAAKRQVGRFSGLLGAADLARIDHEIHVSAHTHACMSASGLLVPACVCVWVLRMLFDSQQPCTMCRFCSLASPT